ncbi:MAG: hypothetical protein WKF31_13205 [Thermoleophilaceae bacterium]
MKVVEALRPALSSAVAVIGRVPPTFTVPAETVTETTGPAGMMLVYGPLPGVPKSPAPYVAVDVVQLLPEMIVLSTFASITARDRAVGGLYDPGVPFVRTA